MRSPRSRSTQKTDSLAHPNIASGSSDLAAERSSHFSKLRATLRRHLNWHSTHSCAGVGEANVPVVSGGKCGISRAVVFHFRPKSEDRPAVNLPQEPAERFATM